MEDLGGSRQRPLGVWGRSSQPPEAVCLRQRHQPLEAKEFGGRAPSAGRFWQLFNKNKAFCAYFGQNNYLKAITHQLKAFEKQSNVLNRINEEQFL